MSLLSQPGKPVWNYLVLMYKQGGKEEETGKRSRRSKQASCSHPSFKGDFTWCGFPVKALSVSIKDSVRSRLKRMGFHDLKRHNYLSSSVDWGSWRRRGSRTICWWRRNLLATRLITTHKFVQNVARMQACGMILKRCSCLLIQNWRNVQERLKPQEEKNEEERTKVSSADMLFCQDCSLQLKLIILV